METSNGFVCTCGAGFQGRHCEENIDECLSLPCVHGHCVDGVNGYTCSCRQDFTGANCDININNPVEDPTREASNMAGASDGSVPESEPHVDSTHEVSNMAGTSDGSIPESEPHVDSTQ